MASWLDSVKIDKVWKFIFNRSRGDSSAQHYEDNIPTSFDVHSSEVYSEIIPSTPPAATTSVIKKCYPIADGGDGWITLTRDKKYNGGRVWVALGTWSSNWSSGYGDISQIMKNFVSPKYGAAYVMSVFNGTDVEIPILDDSSWLFDYKSGVLTFESDRAETGSSEADSIKIKVYQYIGKFVGQAGSTGPSTRYVQKFTSVADDQVNYVLSRTPLFAGEAYVDVYVNGLLAEGVTVVGNTVTLSNAELPLSSGAKVTIKYF